MGVVVGAGDAGTSLPFSATEDALRTLFAQHGTVDSVTLITDRETGRLRGFGISPEEGIRSRVRTRRSPEP